jgi:hypothetical protein
MKVMTISSAISDAVGGVTDSAAATLAAANLKARIEGEAAALRMYFLPDSFVSWYQSSRAYHNIEPPTLVQMPILIVAIPLVISFIVMNAWKGVKIGGDNLKKGATGKLKTDASRILFILICILLLIAIFALIFYLIPSSPEDDVASAQRKIGPRLAGFQNAPSIPDSAYTLLNIQTLSVKQAGFIGPKEQDGIFDPLTGIQTAIRSGVTFFTLQIDYLEREKGSNFDNVGVPTLLYRSSSGKLLSNNGASISAVAQQLANYMFNPDLRASKYPIIVYLHFVRTPDPINKPTDYFTFLKRVSEALKPIHQYILSNGAENYRRQQSEASLLQLALPSVSNSVILLSNADTTIFRNSEVTGGSVSAVSDLDSFINMRVYLDDPSDNLGVTQIATNTKASAVIVPYSRIKGMSESDRVTFAMKGKTRFVIAMPLQMENPSYADIKSILTTTGVNAIPINLIGTDPEPVNKIINMWSSSLPFYMLKPMMLRSYKLQVTPKE